MSDLAIRCEGLSKQYRLGQQERYKALRDVLTEAATSPFRRVRSALARNGSGNGHSAISSQRSALPSETRNAKREARNSESTIWALDNVSFDVKAGEVIGIIGRN